MIKKTALLIIAGSLFLVSLAGNLHAAETETEGFVYDSKGRRDPFIPLITQNLKVATGLETVQTIEDVILEGIVWDSGGDSIAVLNGVIVKVGEEIGSVKIKNITNNTVELYINRIEHTIVLTEKGEEYSE